MHNEKRGNIIGISAILLWSTLALFTVITNDIPPFELVSISFFVASFIGLFMLRIQKHSFGVLFALPWYAYIIGIAGLFGYHFFYFFALKNAPIVEANLLNYLWPLLIVLFSALLPNEKLRWFHIVGSLCSLLGAILLVSKNGSIQIENEYFWGYLFAVFAALTWSSYSVLSKRLAHIPTYSVTAFCILTAFFSMICHLSFETTVIPTFTQLLGAIALGLGPVGGAFYLWDYGMKNGNIKILGSLAYFAPLLSTFLLIIFLDASMTMTIALACFLIIMGSLISSAKNILQLIKEP
jgi:drug/metabolite transporter (DMT)-like permease